MDFVRFRRFLPFYHLRKIYRATKSAAAMRPVEMARAPACSFQLALALSHDSFGFVFVVAFTTCPLVADLCHFELNLGLLQKGYLILGLCGCCSRKARPCSERFDGQLGKRAKTRPWVQLWRSYSFCESVYKKVMCRFCMAAKGSAFLSAKAVRKATM
jgi:hypothetical protein